MTALDAGSQTCLKAVRYTEHEMTNAVKPGGSTGRAVACLSQDKDTFQQLNADLFPVVMVIDV